MTDMIDAALLVEQVAKALAALRHENPDMLDMLVDVYNIPVWQAKYGADARAAVALVLRAVGAAMQEDADDYEDANDAAFGARVTLGVWASDLETAATAVEGQK